MAQAPKKWNEVVQSEGFQSLSPEQKSQAQQQYFDSVVAPQVPEGERETALQQFTTQNPVVPQVDPAEQLMNAQRQAEAELRVAKADNGVVSTADMINGTAPKKKPIVEEVIQIKQTVDAAFGNRTTAGGYLTQPNDPRAQTVDPQTLRAPTSNPELASQYEGSTGTLGAIVDNVAQGLTFGYADEIEARLASTFSGEDYDTELQNVRARQAANEADSPVTSALANLTGEALSGAGIARGVDAAGDALSLGNRTRAASQVGAATTEGAISGTGYSEAELGSAQSNDAAITGGVFGAVGGTIGEGATVGLNRAMDSATLNQAAGQRSVQRTLQEIQQDQNLTDDELIDQVAGQLDQVEQGGGRAVLADADGLQDLARGANQVTQINQSIREDIGTRQGQLEQSFLESVDPTVTADQQLAGSQFPNREIGGREITQNEIIPRSGRSLVDDAGIVNLEQYIQSSRRDGNDASKPLYAQAYTERPNTIQFETMRNMIERSPTLGNAYQQGLRNALDINLANGVKGRPSFTQVMDETSKVLGNQARNTDASQGQSKAGLTGLKSQVDELLYEASPSLRDAREAASQGQRTRGFVEGGKEAVDADSIDAVDEFVRSYDFDTPEAQQAALGAGRAIREAVYNQVSRGTRDAGTGKLLDTRQIEQYNRVIEGMSEREVVNNFLNADARAFRTKEISEINRRSWQEELRSALPTDFRGAATLASLAAVVATPSPISFSIAAARAGQVAASKMNDRQLAKQLQTELFTHIDGDLATKKKYVENLLKGDFGNIPSKQLEAMGRGLSTAIGSLTAQENIETQEQ